MLTTAQIRSAWAPACTGPFARVALNGSGAVSVRPAAVDAVKALNACLVAAGYQTRAGDTGAFNCRPITGGSGYSLHAYGIALDINWATNPYGPVLRTDMPRSMVDAIQAIRTNNGRQVWRWGGSYSGNKDAMHYEIVCTPADLATGIAGQRTPAPAIDWAAVRRFAAGTVLTAIQGLGALDGASVPGLGVAAVQQALGLLGYQVPVTGVYDRVTIDAVAAWQTQLRSMFPGKLNDPGGAFHDGTRFFTCLALRNIADGKT